MIIDLKRLSCFVVAVDVVVFIVVHGLVVDDYAMDDIVSRVICKSWRVFERWIRASSTHRSSRRHLPKLFVARNSHLQVRSMRLANLRVLNTTC